MKKKVLIIEDNNDIRENVVEILELADYVVFAANNGKIGMSLALAHLPDIILCDIMMPELDGYGVLTLLNKHAETESIPFIFLTAKAERADMRKGMDMGADDYLTKPFDDRELLTAIDSRLKKKTAQENSFSKSLASLQTLVQKHGGLDELSKIIHERKNRSFKKGQVIYYEGDRGTGLFLVISGKVKTIKIAEDGRELLTGIFSSDEYLGIHAMVASGPYNDTAIAMEDCSLCMIPKEQLEKLLDQYPEISKEFIKLLANDVREKEEQLVQLAYHSVRKRMADAILRLIHRNAGINSLKVSREDLAAMAGIATETVSRTLSDFKDEGLIEKIASTITVLDVGRLAKMKN